MSEDDPWIEHARWSVSCVYVLKMKGEEFVSLIKMAVEIVEREEAKSKNGGGNQALQNSNETAPGPVVPAMEVPKESGAANSSAAKDLPGSVGATYGSAGSTDGNVGSTDGSVGATDGSVVRGAESSLPAGNSDIQKYLLTDAAQSVLDMGYQPKLVLHAIERVLMKKGSDVLTGEIIMEVVFEIDEENITQSKSQPVPLQSAEGDKGNENGTSFCSIHMKLLSPNDTVKEITMTCQPSEASGDENKECCINCMQCPKWQASRLCRLQHFWCNEKKVSKIAKNMLEERALHGTQDVTTQTSVSTESEVKSLSIKQKTLEVQAINDTWIDDLQVKMEFCEVTDQSYLFTEVENLERKEGNVKTNAKATNSTIEEYLTRKISTKVNEQADSYKVRSVEGFSETTLKTSFQDVESCRGDSHAIIQGEELESSDCIITSHNLVKDDFFSDDQFLHQAACKSEGDTHEDRRNDISDYQDIHRGKIQPEGFGEILKSVRQHKKQIYRVKDIRGGKERTSYNKSFWPSDGKNQVDTEKWYLKWSLDHPFFINIVTVLAIPIGTEPLPPRWYIAQNDYRYHYECVRLATFSQYRGSGFGTRLAQSGFVYDASRNMVVCPWDGSDVNEITRNQHFMSCAFARQFHQINIPLHEAPSPPLPAAFALNMAAIMTFSPATEEQPDRIQSQTETDSIEVTSREELNQNAVSGLVQSSEGINAADIGPIGLTDQEERYCNNSSSLHSFNTTLHGMISQENDIDRNYTEDQAKNTSSNYHSNTVNSVAIKDASASTGVAGDNATGAAASTPSHGNTEIQKYLLTDAAQSVLDMGYQHKLVQRAIEKVLLKKGTEDLTGQIILEAVFEIEEETVVQPQPQQAAQSAEGHESTGKGSEAT